jgi:GTP pyrophosphokinase
VSSKAEFLKLLVLKVSHDELVKISLAYDKAESWHRFQQRDNGEPYFNHLRDSAVSLVVEFGITDSELIIVTLLHDSLEDLSVGYRRIYARFGARVAAMELVLSKPKKSDKRYRTDEERHEAYRAQLAIAGAEVLIVKLIDRLHNVRTLGNCLPDKWRRKIIETAEHYLPLIERIRPFYPEVAEKLDTALRSAITATKAELKIVEIKEKESA